MGFLEEFFTRSGTDGAAKKRSQAKKKRTTVKFNHRYDQRRYDQILDAMKKFDLERRRLCETVETGNGMTSDVFFALYKTEPEFEDLADVREDYWLNAYVRDKLVKSKEYEELRALGTRGDELNAALGFCSLRPTLEELYDQTKVERDLVQEMQRRQEELARAIEEMADLDDQISELEEQLADPEPDEGDEQDGEGEGGAGAGDDEAEGEGEGEGDDPNDIRCGKTPVPGQGQGNPSDEQSAAQQKLQAAKQRRQQLAKQHANLEDAVAAARAAADQSMAEKDADLERELRKGIKKAAEDAEQMQAAMQMLSYGTQPGQMKRIPIDEQMKLAQRIQNNPDIIDLARRIGQNLRVLETEIRKNAPDARSEVRDVELGDNIPMLLPIEQAALRNPRLRKDALCRLEDRAMLQMRLGGDERTGLGGIICAIDGSGSMEGLRHRWAKAIGGALMIHAHEANRSFLGIHFGSASEIEEFPFTKADGWQPDKVLAFFEHFWDGGTDFQVPLSAALDHLRKEHAETGVVRGDIVFVTDGACNVRDDWLEEFKAEQERLSFHVFGVRIGGIGSGYGQGTLDRICDEVVDVSDLSSPDDMRGIFRNLHRS